MKIIYRNHIELWNKKRREKEALQIKNMLDLSKKERKIWISGQNL